MSTRNCVFSEHQQDFVEALVQSGRYSDADDIGLGAFLGQLQ